MSGANDSVTHPHVPIRFFPVAERASSLSYVFTSAFRNINSELTKIQL